MCCTYLVNNALFHNSVYNSPPFCHLAFYIVVEYFNERNYSQIAYKLKSFLDIFLRVCQFVKGDKIMWLTQMSNATRLNWRVLLPSSVVVSLLRWSLWSNRELLFTSTIASARLLNRGHVICLPDKTSPDHSEIRKIQECIVVFVTGQFVFQV